MWLTRPRGRLKPGAFTLIPALVAIFLAIVTREVLLALFAGVWAGVFLLTDDWLETSMRVIDTWIIEAAADTDHFKILTFTSVLGGVVAMVSRMGGVKAIVEAVARRARSGRGAQIATWFMGIFIFFDDYANALLVGNTMRPITDRLKISREKLAYLVDSTAAPISCVAVISTWIAAEISYIDGWLKEHPEGVGTFRPGEAYAVFLNSIPYTFYPIFALIFALLICVTGRDFGPMRRAELRARKFGKVIGDKARPMISQEMEDASPIKPNRLHWWNGLLPILFIIVGTIGGLYWDGKNALPSTEYAAEYAESVAKGDHLAGLRIIFSQANSYNVLLWATLGGLVLCWALALLQGLMGLRQATETTVSGMKAMLAAGLVLILAWTLASLIKTLNTSGYLIEQVSFSLEFIPAVAFLLAGVVAFATGTSWGTMSILIPLILTFAQKLGVTEGADPETMRQIILGCVGAVLAGAVFGDHCSPISDTTVMSSMACGSDHIDHVKTQLPYAMVVGFIALFLGYLPAGFGISLWLLLPAGLVALWLTVRFAGRPLPDDLGSASPAMASPGAESAPPTSPEGEPAPGDT